ncbi:MAG: HAMP domain-containing histidine kinase, partial [Candidatus Eremiobacteraeota bacterium]|nr:HAMP domain-containing histidine kinase [Candidatus Eremiobacteraeota bacterium]
EHQWESRTMLINNVGQLFINLLVGGLCLVVLRFYRQILTQEQEMGRARRDTVDYLIHEVRNPLFAARGTIRALEYRGDGPAELARVRELLEGVESMLEQLHDAHSPDRRFEVHARAIDLVPTLRQFVDRFAALDSRHHYRLETSESLESRCDPELVKRILENLLGNAVKYSEPGPVTVSARLDGPHCLVVVEDQGPGLAEDECQQIFERHRRGRAGRAGPPGLGVGLFLARSYAEVQSGSLRAEPGRKGRFELRLPCAS